MRCLYEVLGLEKDVEDAAIRSAYRKLALKWHPDKNQDKLAHAEEQFKEIQNAYEILGDPHERAWYDSHRDAILRSGERHQAGGGGGWSPGERPDDEVDLYAYFTAAAYSGFGDGPRGFYSVYRELFKTMAQQEGGPMPEFGMSDSPWSEVSAFYTEWSNFRTSKDFAWADKYNTAAGENRKIRRAMDQENEKARKAVKKEYNETVRELVAFLKKRDKRVAAYQVEQAKKRLEREKAEKARREAERLERLERARQYKEAEWTTTVESEEEEEEYIEEEQLLYYCIACEKHFKSEAALVNHERSKKHLERLDILRAILEQEEAEYADSQLDSSSSSDDDDEATSSADSDQEEESSSDDEEEALTDSSDVVDSGAEDSDDEAMLERLILSHKGKQQQVESDSSSEDDDEVENSDKEEEEVKEEAGVAPLPPSIVQLAIDSDGDDDDDDWGTTKPRGKQGKAKQKKDQGTQGKKGKGAAGPPAPSAAPQEPVELLCSVCGFEFPSRNALFKHIKTTGHAALKTV